MTLSSPPVRSSPLTYGKGWQVPVLLALAALALAPRLVGALQQRCRELPANREAAARSLGDSRWERIEHATAITADLVRVLERQPRDAEVIIYTPLTGSDMTLLLRTQWERMKNLVWPHPRVFTFAQGLDAAVARVEPSAEGRLVLIDYTVPQPEHTQVPGEWTLLHTGTFERVWLLRKAVR